MNIILIGMPGCGKSTVGVILAKVMGMHFCDTDIVIQEREGRKLQDIINTDGNDAFLDCEQRALLSIDAENTVIATGGSAIYSDEAMQHLKKGGKVVYLKVSEKEIERRLADFAARGVAIKDGMTVLDLYNERVPLYEKYADITVVGEGWDIPAVIGKIAEGLARL
ncbi:MAG: shikimate kinase [Ruminococcaceae bacterium]|nr:shikimate kinase [Oscillospiraceae bacterium]